MFFRVEFLMLTISTRTSWFHDFTYIFKCCFIFSCLHFIFVLFAVFYCAAALSVLKLIYWLIEGLGNCYTNRVSLGGLIIGPYRLQLQISYTKIMNRTIDWEYTKLLQWKISVLAHPVCESFTPFQPENNTLMFFLFLSWSTGWFHSIIEYT